MVELFRAIFRRILPGIILIVFLPDPAGAWGPGVHYFLASRLLEAGAVGASIGALIADQAPSFLYGNVVADIIVGKNMIRTEDHSHHWDAARTLRRNANGDEEEAFALGYWTHLAADTVAHNIFLQEQQQKGFSSDRFGHAYWELQAERQVPETYHRKVGDLINESFGKQRRLLQDSMPRTVLPFRLNWLIMDGYIQLTGRQTPKQLASVMNRYTSPSLEEDALDEYLDLAESRMEESLESSENRITRLNPIGKGGRFLP